ncbi:uncharacterized protein LOC112191578 [Rosa chinensis]|uniref:uncharacterized protein LOC112191578 n=1 Tax=Rosa chinensis TaxID=74649 RepID=UPI001AD9033B|nr:uncharacterized protein LOC112191578 [Rosa chinensis]
MSGRRFWRGTWCYLKAPRRNRLRMLLIGCMNGIFQIFDRHQVLTGRRISHHKRLPPGNSHYSNGGLERESNNPYHWQAVTGKHGIKKQPFQLPDFIAATGTEKIRQGEVETYL